MTKGTKGIWQGANKTSFCLLCCEMYIADTCFLQKMSSNLTSFVPVLDGTNYQQWAAQMQLYLMSQGQWPCVTKNPPMGSIIALPPSSATAKKPVDDEEEAEPSALLTDADAIVKWDENNTKAVGNIRLCLHHTISYQFNNVESAKKLWAILRE